MDICKLGQLLDKITQSGQSPVAAKLSKDIHDAIYGYKKSSELRAGYIDEDIQKVKADIKQAMLDLKAVGISVKDDISVLKEADKIAYESGLEAIIYKATKLYKKAKIDETKAAVVADVTAKKNEYAKQHNDTTAKLDKAQEVQQEVANSKDKLVELKNEKNIMAKDNTVAARLFEIGNSILGKAKTPALYQRLIKGNKDKVLTEADEKLMGIGLDNYFVANNNGTNLRGLSRELEDSKVDMGQYRKAFAGLLDGINKLFNDGKIKLTDTTILWDIAENPTQTLENPDGFGIISKLLQQQDPGSKEFHQTLPTEVKQAIAVATLDWLYEDSTDLRASNRSDKDLLSMLGKSDEKIVVTNEMRKNAAAIDGLITQEANKIGSKIYKYLQLKAGKGSETVNTEIIEAKMKTELGLLAMAAMENAGTIKMYYKGKDSKEDNKMLDAEDIFGKKGEGVKAFIFTDSKGNRLIESKQSVQVNGAAVDMGLRDSIDAVRDVVDAKIEKHGVYATAEEAIPKLAAIVNDGPTGIVSAVSWLHKKAVQKQSGTANNFVKSYFDVIDGLTGMKSDDWGKFTVYEKETHALSLAQYLGYVDPETVHITNRPGVIGKNNAILLDIKHLMEARAEFGDNEMYARWKVITNNRFMIDSNKLNWQDKKLHRHSVATSDVVIKGKTEDMFKLAIAQSFGMKVDKLTKKTALGEKYDMLAAKIYELLTDGEGHSIENPDIEAAIEYLVKEKGNEPTHAMMGLGEFIRYTKWQEEGMEGEFRSGLRLETDDTTSGYILKLMQMPIFTNKDTGQLDIDKIYEELARGGVTDISRFTAYKTFGERLEATGKYEDSYEKPAGILKEELSKAAVADTEKHGLAAAIKLLGGDVDLASNNINKITRIIMKHPFMTLNYGSAVGTIITNLVNSIMYGNPVTGVRGVGGALEDIANGNKVGEQISILRGLVELAAIKDDGSVNKKFIAKKMNDLDRAIEMERVLEHIMFTPAEDTRIKNKIEELIGEPINNTFYNTYGDLIKATSVINNATTAQFRIGKLVLDSTIEGILASRLKVIHDNEVADGVLEAKQTKAVAPLTTAEVDAEIAKLANVFPVFATALSLTQKGDVKASMLIAGTKKIPVEDYKGANISGWAKLKQKGGNAELGASSELYGLIEKYSSGAVIPIHFLDGSRQATLLAKLTALGVHDANYGDAATIEEITREANKITYELAREYSLTTEMLKSMVATIEAADKNVLDDYTRNEMNEGLNNLGDWFGKVLEDNKLTQDRFITNVIKYKYKAIDSLKLDKETEEYKQIRSVVLSSFLNNKLTQLIKLHDASETGREELFNNSNMQIEHAYLEGAEFKPGKVSKYVRQEVSGVVEATNKLGIPYPDKLADKETETKSSKEVEFDKLPHYRVGQKTMTYAGIGSRETPAETLGLMTKAAQWLESKGYKLQTGKTFGNREEGADKAFSDGTKNKELFGPERATERTIAIAKEMHPAPQHLKDGGLKLMARNTNQVFGAKLDTPVDFVLFYAKETKGIRPEGGTGQAVEMARLKDIPTINMADKDWRKQLTEAIKGKNVVETYEVSTKGDKRFSALVAKLKDGRTIEEAYQLDVKGYRGVSNDWKYGKGKPPKNKSLNMKLEYQKLWDQWADENPKLIQELRDVAGDKELTDQFAKPGTVSQATALMNILKRESDSEIVDDGNSIYAKLGDKTESGNVKIVKDIFANKGNKKIITAFRVDKKIGLLGAFNKYNAIGNPINWQTFTPRFNDDNATKAFIDWMLGNDYKDLEQDYRQAILDNLDSLKGQKIEYYKELNQPSHATALDYLINKYNWSKVAPEVVDEDKADTKSEEATITKDASNIVGDIATKQNDSGTGPDMECK